jgi:hypothetical protein
VTAHTGSFLDDGDNPHGSEILHLGNPMNLLFIGFLSWMNLLLEFLSWMNLLFIEQYIFGDLKSGIEKCFHGFI